MSANSMPSLPVPWLGGHLVRLAERSDLLPGADQWVLVHVDSVLRPVFGKETLGASFENSKAVALRLAIVSHRFRASSLT